MKLGFACCALVVLLLGGCLENAQLPNGGGATILPAPSSIAQVSCSQDDDTQCFSVLLVSATNQVNVQSYNGAQILDDYNQGLSLPTPNSTDMYFQIVNTSEAPIILMTNSDMNSFTFAAENVQSASEGLLLQVASNLMFTDNFNEGTANALQPNDTINIPLNTLGSGFRQQEFFNYIFENGTYNVRWSGRIAMQHPGVDNDPVSGSFETIAFTSNTIQINAAANFSSSSSTSSESSDSSAQ